jgi:hypothetical protein
MNMLGEQGSSAVVRNIEDSKIYVFKDLHFEMYLGSLDDFLSGKDIFYHEFRTVSAMPSHPDVRKPSDTVVVSTDIANYQEGLVCCTLYPVMKNGSLDEKVVESERAGARPAPQDNARWCRQMASAIYHTHFVGKLGNFLLDDHLDLILVDWEQNEAPRSTLAPEANGNWDVEEVEASFASGANQKPTTRQRKLVYQDSKGP